MNAPAAAVKTEGLSGAFTPNASVMARAKERRSKPLKNAVARVNSPRINATPNSSSASVAIQATPDTAACGTNQFNFAV